MCCINTGIYYYFKLYDCMPQGDQSIFFERMESSRFSEALLFQFWEAKIKQLFCSLVKGLAEVFNKCCYFVNSYFPWFKIFYELLNTISDIRRGQQVSINILNSVKESPAQRTNYNRLQNWWDTWPFFGKFWNIPIPGKTSPLPPAQCWLDTKWP